jgi:hypothetical protein
MHEMSWCDMCSSSIPKTALLFRSSQADGSVRILCGDCDAIVRIDMRAGADGRSAARASVESDAAEHAFLRRCRLCGVDIPEAEVAFRITEQDGRETIRCRACHFEASSEGTLQGSASAQRLRENSGAPPGKRQHRERERETRPTTRRFRSNDQIIGACIGGVVLFIGIAIARSHRGTHAVAVHSDFRDGVETDGGRTRIGQVLGVDLIARGGLPDFSILEDEVYDAPLKSQIVRHILVPKLISRAELESLLIHEYVELVGRRGFIHHVTPTNVYVCAYPSYQHYRADFRYMLGRIGQCELRGRPERPDMHIDEHFMAALRIPETTISGRSCAERERLYRTYMARESMVLEATSPGSGFGFGKSTLAELQPELQKWKTDETRALDQLKLTFVAEHRIAPAELEAILAEGLERYWARPSESH